MSRQPPHPLLDKALYVFRLPEEITATLQLPSALNALTTTTKVASDGAEDTAHELQPEVAGDGAVQQAKSCALCGLTFTELQEQRDHYRSDLHHYNLKQKMHNLPPVDEAEFDRRIQDLDESISGSDASATDSDDDSQDDDPKGGALAALLKRQANLEPVNDDSTEEPSRKRKRGSGKPPLLWFTSSRLPPDTALGVYRAILPPNDPVQSILTKQLAPKPSKATQESTEDDGGVPLPSDMHHKPIKGPHYFLCMIGGGHFAAMIVDLTPTVTRKGNIEDRSANVVAHKTFHRYTTRRKQGGSQSANDNSKGNAHSAGSSLRRYNEAALITDIRSLLSEWKPWLATAELLFVRAAGTTNKRTLYGPYDGQVLTADDPRLRSFPFATRRATQAELMRSFVELTRVKISSVSELAATHKAQEEQSQPTPAKPLPAPKTQKPKPSKQEEEAVLHTSQIQALIRRSKAPALVAYLASNALSPDLHFTPASKPENHHAPTPLHLAASLNSSVCVSALLLKARADPTVRSAERKTPIELAGDRATRDAFRLARGELGEAAFAWDAAGVGSALSKAEGEARARSDREEVEADKARESERRKAEVERLRSEDGAERERKFGKGKSLAAAVAKPLSAEERRADESRGLTPEGRARLERERRARAAEARLGLR